MVIDVRNNNGGFINGYVLDVFSRRQLPDHDHRAACSACPAAQNLGQRALGSPTILVTNESSLSDAEDFTEGYRYLGLGKVVGVPTAGWIIYTGGQCADRRLGRAACRSSASRAPTARTWSEPPAGRHHGSNAPLGEAQAVQGHSQLDSRGRRAAERPGPRRP